MNKKLLQSKMTIFIFDSGVGGISIYNKIKKIFPEIHFIYLLDNKFFPYGIKSKNYIYKRCLKILKKISYHYYISLAIIACNTASVSSLPIIKNYFSFPIIGVSPIIKDSINITNNGIIGIIATKTTLENYSIQNKIKYFRQNYIIEILSSQKLVFLVEKKIQGLNISLKEIKNIFQPWYNLKNFPDTIILGCTHFPLIINELKNILPKNVKFLDSSNYIISKIKKIITKNKFLFNTQKNFILYTKYTVKIKKIQKYLISQGFSFFKKIKIN
ncbi:glutamate racemase [Enterobacteriaceae endosymbiont of Plateumaris consimilis]|uniref:glutamate racemase n=1 Tax=Enterobacteriaceae endosymbiont of Plateumaris consimilis TaxID=2675794 RepID=UPI001448B69F|nr:glutamate racemase [Enterobacteriaceae endosymbiont of Plateumaris consimilis]QJC28751.1 glutamate racemase [Enterobacteriaceae endosymbiont of Plateumaris consimilis]